jgi:hypothetical protein
MQGGEERSGGGRGERGKDRESRERGRSKKLKRGPGVIHGDGLKEEKKRNETERT